MKVCIIGLGYIGFPTACLIGHAGHEAVGVDIDPSIVERLSRGDLPMVNEQGLTALAQGVLESGRLRLGTRAEAADVFIIAVPTPVRHLGQPAGHGVVSDPHTADLSYVEVACRGISPHVRPGNLVILESTVPPRTTEKVVRSALAQAGVDVSAVDFAHAPERVLPGNILYELVHNSRIVGGLTPQASQRAGDFYRTFVQGEVVATDATTAELVKLMENTFRDTNIALANEFARVCEHLEVDVWEAIALANRHPRVQFMHPGPGVGGHCIAVDPYFIIAAAPGLTPLIQTARQINRQMPMHVVELFQALTTGESVGKVAVLGAAYKADVADERESPALQVAGLLANAGYTVVIHDPHVRRFSRPLPDVLSGADAMILLTDHTEYRRLDPSLAAGLMSNRFLLDTRGHLDAARWRAAGFRVMKLGSGK